MSTSRRILKNFLSLSIAEVATRVMGTFLGIFIARYLGVNAFGQIAFATAFTSYFIIFSDFGLSTLGIRDIAKDKSQTTLIANNILFLQLVISIILVAILSSILIVVRLDSGLKLLTFLYGLSMIPGALGQTYIFQAHEKMELVAIPRIVMQFFGVGITFIFLASFKSIYVVPITQFLAGIIGAIIIYYLLRRFINYRWGRPSKFHMELLLKQSVPFVISAVAVSIYSGANSVILQFIKGTDAVGYYSAGYKLIAMLVSIGVLLGSSFFPLLSASFNSDLDLFNKTIKFWSRINGTIVFPLCFGGIVLANQIIDLVYGSNYLVSVLPFQILLILPLFSFIDWIYASALISANHQKDTTVAYCVGALVSIIINIGLTPRYGVLGATIATVISEIIIFGLFQRSFHLNIKTRIETEYLFKPLFASILMSIVVILLKNVIPLFGLIGVGSVVYLGIMFVIKGIEKADFDYIRKLKK